jgi:UDP-2,4-diacetamido-2,4,6-trideoxy-beta-L-altropyranose hydrolase
MTESTVVVRPATAEDCHFYWTVNNEPSTRAQSISPEPIPWESHQRWYAQHVDSAQTHLCIAEVAGERVGVFRFDLSGHESTISIAVSPEHRSKGLGREIIASGTRATLASNAVQRVVALVRPDNVGSVRAFLAAGYVRDGQAETNGVELLRFVAS